MRLNFSTFASYVVYSQYKLSDNISREIKEGDMAVGSHTLIHRDAILSDAQKLIIIARTDANRKQL
jgi:hypothetical protein